MAKTITNISNSKIITIGDVVLLPGQTATVPVQFEKNPVLKTYRDLGFVLMSEGPVVAGFTAPADDAAAVETKSAETKAESDAEAAENLRKARLASLKEISEEGLGSLAKELGINPADCKDQKDVLAKVRSALKKA